MMNLNSLYCSVLLDVCFLVQRVSKTSDHVHRHDTRVLKQCKLYRNVVMAIKRYRNSLSACIGMAVSRDDDMQQVHCS